MAVLGLWEEARVRRGVIRSASSSRRSAGEGLRVFSAPPRQLHDGGISIARATVRRYVDGGVWWCLMYILLFSNTRSADDFKAHGPPYPNLGGTLINHDLEEDSYKRIHGIRFNRSN